MCGAARIYCKKQPRLRYTVLAERKAMRRMVRLYSPIVFTVELRGNWGQILSENTYLVRTRWVWVHLHHHSKHISLDPMARLAKGGGDSNGPRRAAFWGRGSPVPTFAISPKKQDVSMDQFMEKNNNEQKAKLIDNFCIFRLVSDLLERIDHV